MGLNDINSLSHTKWNCKYHIVFAPKYRRKVFYKDKRIAIGKNTSRIAEYIKNQPKEDQMSEQLTMSEIGPFTGGK